MRTILFKPLKAGALYYAILVSFLVALLSGFLMLNVWYHHFHTMALFQQQRLERNTKSALVLALELPDLLKTDQPFKIDLFDAGDDEVSLTKKQWGGFYLIKSEAIWKNSNHASIELCGSDIFRDEPIALYLADKERYLSVSGNTLLKGNCYLPKLGIRRAYIEGMSFVGNELVNGEMKVSKTDLPDIESSFAASNSPYFSPGNFPTDSVVAISRFMKSDSISNSFYNKTVVFYTEQWLNLSNKYLKGNIKIISSKGITLSNKSQIQDIIIYAPKIEVESGFSGQVQLFVRDSLFMRGGSRLLFPSLIAMLDANIKKPIIEIEKKCSVSGDIVMLAAKNARDVQPECKLNEECEINGRIYCQGKLHAKGIVNGSVYCNGFILQTPSSLYENHLLNVKIDFTSLSNYYSGAVFLKITDRLKGIKWLY